jgi:hypothetical protein
MLTDRTWTFEQATGWWIDPTGKAIFKGAYAGNGKGKNNPDMQDVKGVGPLPRGLYTAGEPHNDAKVGNYAMRLTPSPDNTMFGRADFFLHGDSMSDPGNASEGCIVLPLYLRTQFWNSGDHTIQVTHG